jgi:hypothetical protein
MRTSSAPARSISRRMTPSTFRSDADAERQEVVKARADAAHEPPAGEQDMADAGGVGGSLLHRGDERAREPHGNAARLPRRRTAREPVSDRHAAEESDPPAWGVVDPVSGYPLAVTTL